MESGQAEKQGKTELGNTDNSAGVAGVSSWPLGAPGEPLSQLLISVDCYLENK
jgi:hypothetical protein